MERLVYGVPEDEQQQQQHHHHLQRVLEWIEDKATSVPMPGIVVWCSGCHRMSVVSHTYYRLLSKERDKLKDAAIATRSAYYTRMCVGAEMWMHMLEMQQLQRR